MGFMLSIAFFSLGILLMHMLDLTVRRLFKLTGTTSCACNLPCEDPEQPLLQGDNIITEHHHHHDDTIRSPFIRGGGVPNDLEMVMIDGNDEKESMNRDALFRTALVTGLAITLHNVPEGFAMFIASAGNVESGLPLAMAIAIHKFPEGLAVALPAYYQTANRWKGFFWGVLTSMSQPVGASVAWIMVAMTNNGHEAVLDQILYGIVFGLIAGMMCYVSIRELLPIAYKHDANIVHYGVFTGMFVIAASLVFFAYSSL